MVNPYDASFDGQVYRRDKKVVIALKRELAVILPVRLAPKVGGDTTKYAAGQVLAKYSASGNPLDGLFVDYDDSGASGRETAVAVLLEGIDSESTSSAASAPAVPAIFAGYVLKDSLVGYDSAAATDLKARELADATGVNVIQF